MVPVFCPETRTRSERMRLMCCAGPSGQADLAPIGQGSKARKSGKHRRMKASSGGWAEM